MNRTAQATHMAAEKSHTGLMGLTVFTATLVSLSFVCVEAGKYAMTAFLGA